MTEKLVNETLAMVTFDNDIPAYSPWPPSLLILHVLFSDNCKDRDQEIRAFFEPLECSGSTSGFGSGGRHYLPSIDAKSQESLAE